MARNKRGPKRRAKWWTRERIILGLHRFYNDFGFCATSSEKWAEYAQFTGVDPETGKRSNLGWHNKYPSFATILSTFTSFREAWTAAGLDVDRSWEPWSPIEDWFVLESVGLLPRSEVSEILKRSVPAIKRRLYDLGDIRSYNRWGITITHAEKLLGMNAAIIRKYINYGIIPYLKGNKLYYLNPADLLKIEEVDWSKPVHPELDQLIRRAVAQRILKMAKFGTAWRDHEVYKFHKTKERFAGRIQNPRRSRFADDLPKPPNDLIAGDWVKLNKGITGMLHVEGRFGYIKALIYSPQASLRRDGTKRECWVARVEFPKIRTITGEKDDRIKWTIPLDCLVRVDKPHVEPKPLKMNPEAIRGRERWHASLKRGRDRFAEIQEELS